MTPNNPSKPVPLEAVEAAAKALYINGHPDKHRAEMAWPDGSEAPIQWRLLAQAAILAADEQRGLKMEEQYFPPHGERMLEKSPPKRYRLVSRWFPIKGPVDE